MFKIIGGLLGALIGAQATMADTAYPVVFDGNKDLAKLGVQLGGYAGGEKDLTFRNKCHYFGDGGILVSLSDEFVAPYIERGFSIPSMCMAMYPGIRFDPGTGRRLATFVVADVEAIEKYGFDQFSISGEVGLELPDCFASGQPLTDCNFQYDPLTGAALTDQVRQNVRGLGEATIKIAREAIKSGVFDKECADDGPSFPDCRTDIYPDTPNNQYIRGYRGREEPQGLTWPVTFLDVSDEFPAGFGYAIFASGEAGPSADLDAEKIAVDPKRRASQAIIESLIVKLKQ